MAYTLPPLPYDINQLEPQMSAQVVDYHYNKHTAKYYETASRLVQGTIFENDPLENLLTRSSAVKVETALYVNASQAWNHTFFWNCLTPNQTTPSERLANAINQKYGSIDEFKAAFDDKATNLVGSGWVWLIAKGDDVRIVPTQNALSPLTTHEGFTPLLTCDVWEHAYYLQYPASRTSYLQAFWDLVNWDFVSEQFEESGE